MDLAYKFLFSLLGLASLQRGLTETCTITTVSQPLNDKKLINHVLESHQVRDRETCEIKCFLHGSCVSYNLGQQPGGSRLCQFSDSDHIVYPEDLTESHGFIYVALENACSHIPCSVNATCVANLLRSSYKCVCPVGFEGDDCSKDIDECATNTHDCHSQLAECQNTVGSFTCSCVSGYSGNGRTCDDIDECAILHGNDCHTFATCTNTAGSYECRCNNEMQGNGKNCTQMVKLNTDRVCFGTADDQYGSVTSSVSMAVLMFQLVYLSGGVTCYNLKDLTNWGCLFNKLNLNTVITDDRNQTIVPEIHLPKPYRYNLPDFHANSIHLNLTRKSKPYQLYNGSEVRVWFTEDLYDFYEFDNNGTSCTDIYAFGYLN